VLKGGTAIRKAYFPQTWRFSEDLDFTVLENTEAEKIRESMQDTFDIILTESGINYSFESFHAKGSRYQIAWDLSLRQKAPQSVRRICLQ